MLVGKPARSCKDFISQQWIITLYQVYYPTIAYEREIYLDNKLGHQIRLMTHIAYFKRQAKNLLKDYKTKTPYLDKLGGNSYYKYDPKYFDIDGILVAFNYNEDDFCLMKAQHIIALLGGFDKWADLSKASEPELELAKAIFDNPDKINIDDWEMYIAYAERENKTTFDSESKLKILKHVFLNGEPLYPCPYRLNQGLVN